MRPAGERTRAGVDYHRRKGAAEERERIRLELLAEASQHDRPGLSPSKAFRDFARRLETR